MFFGMTVAVTATKIANNILIILTLPFPVKGLVDLLLNLV